MAYLFRDVSDSAQSNISSGRDSAESNILISEETKYNVHYNKVPTA